MLAGDFDLIPAQYAQKAAGTRQPKQAVGGERQTGPPSSATPTESELESNARGQKAMEQLPGEVTVLLRKAQGGQIDAADQLVRLVYSELRRIAGAFMRGERQGHTLQPTALINEAWLRLADQTQVDWRDRAHFFGVAAQMMRRVLVDHARARLADKRGAGAAVVGLDWVEIDSGPQKVEEILAVDEALDRLLHLDSQQAQIVEMRYFAGMTVKETAEVLRVSTRTVDREFALASAWLRRELAGRSAP